MRRRLRVRALRPRLMIVVALGAALTLTLLTVGFNVVLDRRLDSSVDDLLRQRASAHLATLSTGGGRLQLGEAPDAAAIDTPTWVFAGSRVLERPAVPAQTDQAARTLAARGARTRLELQASDTRLYAVPIVAGGRRLGTLVVGASVTASERSARTALVASIVFALLMLAAILIAARWAIAAALKPVAEMTRQAERSSETDLDRRLSAGEPYDEVTRLAATFDHLLARLAAGLRRERSFSAEVSHELRTPLARLAAEADLALSRERTPRQYRQALTAMRRDVAEITRTLETLLAAARADGGDTRSISDARDAIAAATRVCASQAHERGVHVRTCLPSGAVPVGADSAAVERVLVPLVENGCRYAAETVTISLRRVGDNALLSVADDGPGVDESIRARLFEPGARGGDRDGHDGAGLGLALTRRLVRAMNGEVECLPSDHGALFEVRLPAV